VRIARVALEEWNKLSKDAHLACFNESRDPSLNTFDFALVVFDADKICAYATILETDKETAYMQHGGSFPETRGSIKSRRAYGMIMNYLREHYKFATTNIGNFNVSMLKFALSEGFLITGMHQFSKDIYLHLYQEFKQGDK
jgi:hypothetical protein